MIDPEAIDQYPVLMTYIAPGILTEVEVLLSFEFGGVRNFVVYTTNDHGQAFFHVRDAGQLLLPTQQ